MPSSPHLLLLEDVLRETVEEIRRDLKIGDEAKIYYWELNQPRLVAQIRKEEQ